ncbi:MAG TPA: hypothetical protein VMB22_04165 [Verrucomicrobiae bacterium]|nr:hypothetical protein [Verrucomicrobiae bacterium]
MAWNEIESSLEAVWHYLLARHPASEHAVGMAESVEKQMAISEAAAPASFSKAKVITIKIIALTAVTLALCFGQSWASTRYYQPDYVAGFPTGLLEGALMPAALPGLVAGKDVPIYAPNNLGRPYKIGFIVGLNACGTFFFWLVFWQPGAKRRANQ